jgi:hypothetical protein
MLDAHEENQELIDFLATIATQIGGKLEKIL